MVDEEGGCTVERTYEAQIRTAQSLAVGEAFNAGLGMSGHTRFEKRETL